MTIVALHWMLAAATLPAAPSTASTASTTTPAPTAIAARAPALSAAPIVAVQPDPGPAVATFYAIRRDAPLWLSATAGTGAQQLIAILRQAPLDGFDSGPRLADEASAAVDRATHGTPADVAAAERLLSSDWVRYAQTISAPNPAVIYGDPARASRPAPALRILQDAARAPTLSDHLLTVSRVNPIYADLRDAAVKAGALAAAPDPRLLGTLARARILPASGRFLLVDIGSQRLSMYNDGKVEDSMKVIVGKPTEQTPLIASTVSYATLNPYWNIPADVIKRVVAPLVAKRGAKYLKAARYDVMSDWTDSATVVDPTKIDWKAVGAGTTAIRIRQKPGTANMMGAMKFSFPNPNGIYLHDTPHKDLFAKPKRTLSLGCIRLEHAAKLGQWLLGRDPTTITTESEQHIPLPTQVPVFVTYLTAHADGGALSYSDDIYALDSRGGGSVTAAK